MKLPIKLGIAIALTLSMSACAVQNTSPRESAASSSESVVVCETADNRIESYRRSYRNPHLRLRRIPDSSGRSRMLLCAQETSAQDTPDVVCAVTDSRVVASRSSYRNPYLRLRRIPDSAAASSEIRLRCSQSAGEWTQDGLGPEA